MSILGKRVTCTNGVNTSAIESKRAKISSFLISSIIEPKQNDESSAVERDRETRTAMTGVHPSTAKPIKQIAKITPITLFKRTTISSSIKKRVLPYRSTKIQKKYASASGSNRSRKRHKRQLYENNADEDDKNVTNGVVWKGITLSASQRCQSPNRDHQREEFGFPAGKSSELADFHCILDDGEGHWRQFDKLGTEMIVTTKGRRIYPSIKVKFRNKREDEKKCNGERIPNINDSIDIAGDEPLYYAYLDFTPVDTKKYSYIYGDSCWKKKPENSEDQQPVRLYPHPNCPLTEEEFKKKPISFERAKITNNKDLDSRMDKEKIEVPQKINSMQRYYARIHIFRIPKNKLEEFEMGFKRINEIEKLSDWLENYDELCMEAKKFSYRTFSLPETLFTAVTAYQNNEVRKLKIKTNPFAKGHRKNDKTNDDGIYDTVEVENSTKASTRNELSECSVENSSSHRRTFPVGKTNPVSSITPVPLIDLNRRMLFQTSAVNSLAIKQSLIAHQQALATSAAAMLAPSFSFPVAHYQSLIQMNPLPFVSPFAPIVTTHHLLN